MQDMTFRFLQHVSGCVRIYR